MPTVMQIPPLVAEKPTIYKTKDPLLKRLRLEDPYGRPIDTIAKDFEGKEIIIFFVGSAFGDREFLSTSIGTAGMLTASAHSGSETAASCMSKHLFKATLR